jgi:hypothetical protein
MNPEHGPHTVAMDVALMHSEEFLADLERLAELHRAKSAGYAGAVDNDPWYNFRTSEAFGVPAHIGVLVRMGDKWSRLQSLIRNPANEQVGESIYDTLDDIASYALIEKDLYREYERSLDKTTKVLSEPYHDPT